MPAQYEAIRDSLLKQGKSLDEARSKAARIYISKGKTKKARSAKAKALHHK